MRSKGMKAVGIAAVCGLCATGIVVGATSTAPAKPVKPRKPATKAKLLSFDDCSALDRYADHYASQMTTAYGMAGVPFDMARRATGGAPETAAPGVGGAVPAAAPAADSASPQAGQDFSGTNNQEDGVDEPDIVKSDGTTAFVSTAQGLRSVAVGATPKVLDTLAIKDMWGAGQLLRSGNRVVVIGSGAGPEVPGPVPPTATTDGRVASGSEPNVIADMPIRPYSSGTIVTLVDVSNPADMRVLETMRLEGRYIAARESDGAVRLVLTTSPNPVGIMYPASGDPTVMAAATIANREAVRTSPIASWMPVYTLQKAGGEVSTARAAVRCRDVRYPTQFSGLSMVSVLTLAPSTGLTPVDRDAVMTDGDIVYGSRDSLYVTTPRWYAPAVLAKDDTPPGGSTQIHRFEVTSPTATRYASSGRVPGYLLSQWAMSEQDGVLRVASTDDATFDDGGTVTGESQSRVTTLRETDGALVRVGQVEGLGKGERIRAVRFIGNTGYVVTFRQTDPLYVLDVSNPAAPVVRGELKIPGYSAYLHPVGDGLLLGVGQDATSEGRVKGTQVSLFDVSDPARPRRVSQLVMPFGWSESEDDHHAFLYWDPKKLGVIPVTTYNQTTGMSVSQAIGVRVAPDAITRAGAITHPGKAEDWNRQIRRSMVAGQTLLTFSEAGVQANDADSLATTGWAPFD